METGRISDVNQFLVDLLGFSHGEMVGKTVGELSCFRDIESNMAILEPLKKDGYVHYENLPLETRDGRQIAVEFVSNVYQAGDKKLIQCNIRDITERRWMETALIHFRSIVESSDDAIMGKDMDGIITSWNKGAEKIFGYTADEIVGTSIMRLIPDDRRDEESKILEKIHRGEGLDNLETLRETKDGKLIDVSVTVCPIKDINGKVIGVSKVAHDITVRKGQEREIERLSRLYAALSQVNQAIVTLNNREELFAKICRVLVEIGKLRMAWVGWLNTETRQVIQVRNLATARTIFRKQLFTPMAGLKARGRPERRFSRSGIISAMISFTNPASFRGARRRNKPACDPRRLSSSAREASFAERLLFTRLERIFSKTGRLLCLRKRL
jgi:PAS domain S-box-containing protein